MTSFSSLRVRLVGAVFLAILPALLALYWLDIYLGRVAAEKHRQGGSLPEGVESHVPWAGFAVGLVALTAAWIGGERFILRQARLLARAVQQLGAGDFSSRTGLSTESGELGELALMVDSMAVSVQQRVRERELAERTLLNRAFQQTVVGALGQFALLSKDFSALLNQAVMLVAQTLEVEYANCWNMLPDRQSLLLRAGVGWKSGWLAKRSFRPTRRPNAVSPSPLASRSKSRISPPKRAFTVHHCCSTMGWSAA